MKKLDELKKRFRNVKGLRITAHKAKDIGELHSIIDNAFAEIERIGRELEDLVDTHNDLMGCRDGRLPDLLAIVDKANDVCEQWFGRTGRGNNKVDMIVFIDLMLKLKQALAEWYRVSELMAEGE